MVNVQAVIASPRMRTRLSMFFLLLLSSVASAAAPATQPTAEKRNPGYKISLKKPADKIVTVHDDARTIFRISSSSGIGGATIQPAGEQWPEPVVLRLYLRGLEFFAVSNGDVKVSAASDGKLTREHRWDGGKEGPALEQSSRWWIGVRAFDASGKPASAVPLQDGWFEITLPKALLEDGKPITLEWIDFYRG